MEAEGMRFRQAYRERQAGFTLVELLVVIAITAILLGLLLIPLVQGFRLTRQGQIQAQAQDTVRLALNQFTNDLKRAAYVFDSADRVIYLPVQNGQGQVVNVPLRYAVIDMVMPAYGDPSQESNDPTSDIPINPDGSYNAEIAVPISPGRTVVRYFIGLMDNSRPYFNPDEVRLAAATDPENYAILYRAEFRLYVRQGNQWVLNPELFGSIQDFFDPNFFYGSRRDAWRKYAKPIVPLGQVDMVNVTYDDNGNPRVEPLMQLTPALVVNQMGAPIETDTLGDEGAGAPPVQIRFPLGLWDVSPESFRLVAFRSRPDALQRGEPLRYFYLAPNDNGEWYIRYYRATPDGQERDEWVANLTRIQQMIETGQPQPNWLNNALNYYTDAEPMAFYVNIEAGLVDLALPWWFQYPAQGVSFKTGAFATPFNDSNPDPTTINGRYNEAYQGDPDNAPNIRRYVSLMDLDNNGSDGRRSQSPHLPDGIHRARLRGGHRSRSAPRTQLRTPDSLPARVGGERDARSQPVPHSVSRRCAVPRGTAKLRLHAATAARLHRVLQRPAHAPAAQRRNFRDLLLPIQPKRRQLCGGLPDATADEPESRAEILRRAAARELLADDATGSAEHRAGARRD
jgi:prepilin-type N-terminal cleavage/methylation domain-containing protein